MQHLTSNQREEDVAVSRKQKHIFLCHSSDDKSFVRRLADDLEQLQVTVWLDEWELAVGDSLHQCIGKAICDAAYIGVVLSPSSTSSKWCQDELEQALAVEKRMGRSLVLPLLHKEIRPPPFLEGRLYLDFANNYYPSLTHLAGTLLRVHKAALLRAVAKKPPESLADCISILSVLEAIGIASLVLDDADYRLIRKTLEKYGIHVPHDNFSMLSSLGPEITLIDQKLGDGIPWLEDLKGRFRGD
jgi:hypothetical protein